MIQIFQYLCTGALDTDVISLLAFLIACGFSLLLTCAHEITGNYLDNTMELIIVDL